MGDVPSGRNVHGAEHPPLTLGTAGHIDHGKTALITRLTGKNTDRLREEQERGISIELGYAELALPSGGRLSVVDVPGHERFVRAMVAGATGIDLFLLVIAADDGVMPQTAEHLAIIELLGVRDGVIALTKADLVDEELLGLASEDVREFLDGTSFAACEMVTVSARDGRGLDELLAALERVADRAETGRRTGPARLPVDRVFPLKGIGTVVTGTLWAGEITAGDTLTVEPGGVRAAVRSVQVHDHEAEVVHAGSRVGVNLRGLDRDEVRRGDWLAGSELAGLAGRRFDAWVSVLPGGRPLRSGDQVRLHHGTAQYLARVAPLEGREIAAGSAAAAVVRLDAPALALSHDRFIIRSLSPVATIAGGEVLLAGAQRWHARERHAAYLEAVRAGDAAAAVRALARDRGSQGVTQDDLTAAGFAAARARKALTAAVAGGELEELPVAGGVGGERWFSAGTPAALRAALLAGATERAAARPERPFTGAAELAALVPALPAADAARLLQSMVEAGDLVAGEGGFAPAGAGVLGDEQAALAEKLLDRLASEPFAPPTLAVLAEGLRRPPRELGQILDVLARRGDVARVDKDLWFARGAVDEARAALLTRLEGAGEVTIAGFRDALGCGRRNAQALLEYFDREGLTLRRGDVRVARRRRS
jgi:selenocysteine-specific elongation factor